MYAYKVTMIIFMYLHILFMYFILVCASVDDIMDSTNRSMVLSNFYNHTCICIVNDNSKATNCTVSAMNTAGSNISGNVDF